MNETAKSTNKSSNELSKATNLDKKLIMIKNELVNIICLSSFY